MILNCSIKRDYLGIPYLIVSSNGALDTESVLVNSHSLGPCPDFCYAFCLRPIAKTNFLMFATEFKAVEACFDLRASVAAESLPYNVKHLFTNLESFAVDSSSVFTLAKFLLRLLPSGPETRALFSEIGEFKKWCEWINKCYSVISISRENSSDYAFYATLLPRRSISRIINLISRDTNGVIEELLESLLKGSSFTNTGVTMSYPVAKVLLESLSRVDSNCSPSFQRVAYYLRSLGNLVFPFDGLDWFESFQSRTVAPIDPAVSAEVVFASAKGVDLTGGEVTFYESNMVSFDAGKAPSISTQVHGLAVAFDKSLLSLTGHVVWGPSWVDGAPCENLTEGLEGNFYYDGVDIHRLAPGMTGYDLDAKCWVSNPSTK